MAKRRDRTAELLDALAAASPGDPIVAEALAHKAGFVVARGAELATDAEVPLLLAAFERLLVAEDLACAGKTAVVRALDRLEVRAHEVYLRAVRLVTVEWEGKTPIDVAVPLRGVAAMALVNARTPQMPLELARLLADREPRARAEAANAMGVSGRPELVPLLWFKAIEGDRDLDVRSEVLTALLAIEGAEMIEPVAGFLAEDDEDRALAAAIALGQSRLPGALAPLIAWTSAAKLAVSARRAGLLAIAALRVPAGMEHLRALVADEALLVARPALEALLIHRYDAAHMRAVEAVVRARGEPKLIAMLA